MKRQFFSCVFQLFCFLTAAGIVSADSFLSAAECVKVESRNGAPCILVDGQPVRPRVFFGKPVSQPLKLQAGENVFDFEFRPIASSQKRGTLHFRPDSEPGTLRLDDLSIIESETGRSILPPEDFDAPDDLQNWRTWHTEVQGTVIGSIAVRNSALEMNVTPEGAKRGIKHDFHVYRTADLDLDPTKNYRVRFRLHSTAARNVRIDFYRPGDPYLHLGSALLEKQDPDPFRPQIRLAADENGSLLRSVFHVRSSEWETREKTETLRHAPLGILHGRGKSPIVQTVGSESLLWVTMDGISTEKLREEARNHGVRLFTNTECNVWANGPFIVLHASKGGPVTVQLKDGTQKTLELKLGETRILRDADF